MYAAGLALIVAFVVAMSVAISASPSVSFCSLGALVVGDRGVDDHDGLGEQGAGGAEHLVPVGAGHLRS